MKVVPQGNDHGMDLETRLAVLSQRVDEGFKRVDEGFDRVDKRFEQIDKRFEGVDKRFEGVEGEIRELRGAFDSLQRTLLQMAGGVIGTLILGFSGVIATQL